MLQVSVCNQQKVCRVNVAAVRRTLRALAQMANEWNPAAGEWLEVTLHLLDDVGITPLNKAIMGHDGATDVITQRYAAIPGERLGIIGEIFVNAECANKRWRRGAAWSADQELALYLAHGCNHLVGADDATMAQRKSMRRRELAWLRRLDAVKLFVV